MLNQILVKGICYTLTAIGTLRAGSRLLYISHNNNTLDEELDSTNINYIKYNDSDDASNELWETVYAFQEAVALREIDHEDGEEEAENQFWMNVKDLVRNELFLEGNETYSLSPYSTYSQVKEQDNNTMSTEVVDDNFAMFGTDTKDISEEDKMTFSKKSLPFLNRKKKKLPPKHKFSIPMNISKTSKKIIIPNSNKTARITSFAIPIFDQLRSVFLSYSLDQYKDIMTKGPFVQFLSNSKGAARLNLVFFISKDGSFLIKQIKRSEALYLLQILSKYHEYMLENSNLSLLTRFFGLYQVQLEEGQDRFLLIMNSIFPSSANKFITEKYDLKGSTVGRTCSIEERIKKGANAILKDLDLRNDTINIPNQLHRAAFLSQVKRDVSFLNNVQVMDYSLLVGIANLQSLRSQRRQVMLGFLPQLPKKNLNLNIMKEQACNLHQNKVILGQEIFSSISKTIHTFLSPSIHLLHSLVKFIQATLQSSLLLYPIPYYNAEQSNIDSGIYSLLKGKRGVNNEDSLFYFGIIDFLQPWTMQKKLEHEIKGVMLGRKKKMEISCVSPRDYAERFIKFMNDRIK